MYFVTYNKLIIHKYHNFLGVSHHMTENHRKCVLEKVNSSHCMYEFHFITFIKIVFKKKHTSNNTAQSKMLSPTNTRAINACLQAQNQIHKHAIPQCREIVSF